MNKANRGVAVFTAVLVIALLAAFLGGGFSPSLPNSPYIAVINITGTISEDDGATYNQAWLLNTIEDLTYDSANRGILLYVDSPGGTVYESDEAYLALMDYKKATERPIIAYIASTGCSGAYYISCAADEIYANRNALTGSIGVIMGSSIDLTGLMDKLGIKSTTIHAGKNKNMFSYDEPVTAEQAAIMQSIADESYEQFTQIVAESRGMDLAELQKLADGRVYTARQAVSNGLIDSIVRDLDEAGQKLCAHYDINYDRTDFITYSYEADTTYLDRLLGISADNAALKTINALSDFGAYYYAYSF